MKFTLILFAQLLSFTIIAQITPRIKLVKVFSNGAEITRIENVKINSGIDTLKLSGLSPFLQNQTIQAKLEGAQILDIKFDINHLKSQKDEPKLSQIKNQIKSIELDILDLKDKLSYLDLEYNLIVSNKSISNEETLDIEDVKDFVQYYKTEMPDLIGKITDTKQQLKKFKTVQEQLKKQEFELQKVRSKSVGEIEILYRSKQNRQSKIELSYHVNRCGWTPFYNMRASNISEPIEFEYNAQVFQNTGVNWTNCKLTITTGNPVLIGNKPELTPWRVFAQSAKNYNYLKNNDFMGVASKLNEKKSLGKVMTDNITFSSFEIPIIFSLNSGSGEKSINIMKKKLPASYQYYAVPKKSNGVFLIAQVTNWEKLPLIPGKSHIYFNGTFVGKSFINPKSLNDTLDVSLGQDQSILVERKKQEEKCVNNSNIMGVTKSRGYDIIVKNNRNKLIKVQIIDQIPISKNNKIKVSYKLGDGWVLKEETGILEWNIEIPPGDKKSISFEFDIKHPKKFNVPL